MNTPLIRVAACLLGAVLATLLLPGCEPKSEELLRAQQDGQKQAAANLAAHERRLFREPQ